MSKLEHHDNCEWQTRTDGLIGYFIFEDYHLFKYVMVSGDSKKIHKIHVKIKCSVFNPCLNTTSFYDTMVGIYGLMLFNKPNILVLSITAKFRRIHK